MRRRSDPAEAKRGKTPRARRCATPPIAPPRRAATDEEHACRIVKLRAQKRQLTQRLDHVNKLLDAELIAARQDKTLYSVIGAAVQVAEGRAPTADDLAKVERELRKLTHHAKRRRDPSGNQAPVDARSARQETAGMPNPIRRRIEVTEEWFANPPGAAPPPSNLAEADLDEAEVAGDDEDDHDELDGDEPEDDDEDDDE